MVKRPQTERIRTVCGINDYFRCGLTVELRDGVIAGIHAADFPDSNDKGGCMKGLASAELVYHPERLRHPLKRSGDRGKGGWDRISWDKAFSEIAASIHGIQERHGPGSIGWMTAAFPNLTGGGYSRLISLTRGTWIDWWGCGDAAGPCADIATFGTMMGEGYLCRMETPKIVIVWGYNPAVTVPFYMRQIVEAKNAGARVVVVDPRFTETASRADEHIPIRPGTDGALALAMINVIIGQGLHDETFLSQNTVAPFLVRKDNGRFLRQSDLRTGSNSDGFVVYDRSGNGPASPDGTGFGPSLYGEYTVSGIECTTAWQLLADMARAYSPERASQITGVASEVINRLAITYATEKPAAIYRGWGIQRTFHGDLACRAVNTLAAATGNINPQRPSTFVTNSKPFIAPAGPYNRLPLLSLHEATSQSKPFPIKALLCAGHNFVNQMPDLNRTVDQILPNIELVVVCDLFMTASAQYADYVLPVCSSMECTDICVSSYRNTYLQLQRKVIDPLYESKSDFQIAAGLGRSLGFGEFFDKTEEQYIEEFLESDHPTMEGVSLQRLKQGPIPARDLSRPQGYNTSTGRIEFYVEGLKDSGEELPVYIEPVEGQKSKKAGKYPLSLLTVHPANRIHSTLALVPRLLRLDPEPVLDINLLDARQRGLEEGHVARVFNDRGEMRLKVRLTENLQPGVVSVTQGWWPQHYIAGHHNALTHGMINEAQQRIFQPNAAFFDVLVEVERC